MRTSVVTKGYANVNISQETSILITEKVSDASLHRQAGQKFRGWRPLTLHPWILVPFALCNALVIVILEYLQYLNKRDDGVFLSSSGGFSSAVGFLYLYLPTMIAVCLSLTWSWIDLDAKRLEPFFQLSKIHGSTVNKSLTLDYPFDYIALVPFKALRRGHWSVVAVGFNTMVIFWVITPLFSAIFTTASISSQQNETGLLSATLLPVSGQVGALTTKFLLDAYCVLWLGQALPAFVTKDSALLPFAVGGRSDVVFANETWQSTTTAYSTSLSCEPAKINGSGLDINYSNGRGCATGPGQMVFLENKHFKALYFGYYTNPYTDDYFLQRMDCASLEFSHTFFAYWAVNVSGKPMITALFCEASYWQTEVRVRVHATNKSVIDLQELEPARPLNEDFFNITNFEYILSGGSPKRSRRADISGILPNIDQESRLKAFGLSTANKMVGFAVGATQQEPEEYLNATILGSAFEKAHKLLFALAAQSLMTNPNTDPNERFITVSGTMKSVTMIRGVVIATQVSLGISLALTVTVLSLNWRRRSQMLSDPACLQDMLKMIDPSKQTSMYQKARSSGCCTARLDKGVLKITECAGEESAWPCHPSHRPQCKEGSQPLDNLDAGRTMRPREMHFLTGAFFQITLIIALTTLLVAKILEKRNNGLSLPSRSRIWTQIFTSYFPVTFATLIEPFWTLLNRALCILKPFHALRNGKALPSNSIRLKYTSLPPPLVVLRALKARHYILALVCMTGVSTNILTVAMGALFHIGSARIEEGINLKAAFLPIIDTRKAEILLNEECFYAAKANLTDGALLPPWTTRENFFLPVNLTQGLDSEFDPLVKVNTTGFGSTLECQEVDADANRYVSNKSAKQEIAFRIKRTGETFTCMDFQGGPSGGQNKSVSAAEILHILAASPGHLLSDSDRCNSNLMAVLFRGNLTVSLDVANPDYYVGTSKLMSINSLSSIWMICKPTFVAAPFEVTVDITGRVRQATCMEGTASNVSDYFAAGLNASYFLSVTSQLWSDFGDSFWHNDTLVDSWFGYLIKTVTNSTELIDPAQQIPTFQAIAPVIGELYSQVFAILLALNTDWLLTAPPEMTVSGVLITTDERLWISEPAFLVAVMLLSLNMAVAMIYYIKRPKKMLRHMPTNILNILELFDGSGLVQDRSRNGEVREDTKLMYGKFIGTDGKLHLGIDRKPFVVP